MRLHGREFLLLCLLVWSSNLLADPPLAPPASEPGFSLTDLPEPAPAPGKPESNGEDSEKEDSLEKDGKEKKDDLDSLLEMSERDLTQLSNVKVTAPKKVYNDPSPTALLDKVVTTVSRQETTVGKTPAGVFIITQEMIRRSGARSLPEVLRMAPGVQVARIDGNKWAISIRGFNQRFSNKLLVQIDGRSVYTPLFAGVFWDVQDVLLEDVERIEVIRGPGATVWGANAVNGVINVITKKAGDTQGLYFQSGGGSFERAFGSVRYGEQITDDLAVRVYGKWFERGVTESPLFTPADDWRMARTGFRMDWEPNDDETLTIQGDFYDGYAGQLINMPSVTPPTFQRTLNADQHLTGGNVLWRYTRKVSDDEQWSLQMYYDRIERNMIGSPFREARNTYDVDFQHQFGIGERHSFIWGLGFRHYDEETRGEPFFISFVPPNARRNIYSLFLQDEVTLSEDLWYFTFGAKLSENDFTGFEVQPSARLLYTPNEQQTLWASISRAVRIPSISSDQSNLFGPPQIVGPGIPVFPNVRGNPAGVSEVLIAYEMGYRHQVSEDFSYDVAMFYNDYDDLLFSSVGPVTLGPGGFNTIVTLDNGSTAESYGFEVSGNYRITESWRLFGSYSFLRLHVHAPANAGPSFGSDDEETSSPRNQLYLQSSWDITENLELDLIGRYVDSLFSQNVPAYFTADIRLAWRPKDHLELFVVGQNLLDASQPEFGNDGFAGTPRTEVPRGVYGGITLRY